MNLTCKSFVDCPPRPGACKSLPATPSIAPARCAASRPINRVSENENAASLTPSTPLTPHLLIPNLPPRISELLLFYVLLLRQLGQLLGQFVPECMFLILCLCRNCCIRCLGLLRGGLHKQLIRCSVPKSWIRSCFQLLLSKMRRSLLRTCKDCAVVVIGAFWSM